MLLPRHTSTEPGTSSTPTGLAPRESMLRITAGRDSSDTAFLSTVGGSLTLKTLKVSASVNGELPVEDPPGSSSACVSVPQPKRGASRSAAKAPAVPQL